MKLSALLYLLPLLYAYFAPDLREQPADYPTYPATRRIQSPTIEDTQEQAQTASFSPHQLTPVTTPIAAQLITRSKPGSFPRVGRSRNLSELCPSPKAGIPCVMALHRTRSAGANQQSISKKSALFVTQEMV